MRALIFSALLVLLPASSANSAISSVTGDPVRARIWTGFADAVHAMLRRSIAGRPVETTHRLGGYGGALADDSFYRETRYTDKETGRLLGWVRRESRNPEQLHAVASFRYDAEGRLVQDYLAVYLPYAHNAPYQTLLNVYHHGADFEAMRQFDASGDRILESCVGTIGERTIRLIYPEEELPDLVNGEAVDPPDPLYATCFDAVPSDADQLLESLFLEAGLSELAGLRLSRGPETSDQVEARIARISELIERSAKPAKLYLQRGDAYFQLREFDMASEDYTTAIELNPEIDEAWYGRGMARGRAGELDEAVADLGEFLRRNPDSSLGYTKRGVRHVWRGDFKKAEKDLREAIRLDPTNAEAHDDLGVMLAQRGTYRKAITHFTTTIRLDPSYQKGYHNLALTHYLIDEHQRALEVIDRALRLNPRARESQLLKAQILTALGRATEAAKVVESAEFLPEANWSESLDLQ
ncbi:MAG: tetratricopeptide repeat protein [Gammaproteobacteria bacterium]|nr:tetratricopeptide repeat protein [Gammaproteobacteria bacterium]